MVSLENRTDYLLRISKIPKLTAFNNLLLDNAIISPQNEELNESDEIYFGVVNAIISNDQTAFESYYNKKNKSQPSKESPSPFVNDDFLIFSLIVGITKFGLDKSWIKNIVSIRNRNAITITLENILNENYQSNDNLMEIVVVYFFLINPALVTNNYLNSAYRSIVNNTTLFEGRSDFQILCAVRAYDLIIELKELPERNEINLLKEFNTRFLKRIKILSWLVQTTLLVSILYGAFELITFSPTTKEYFDKIGSILKILGYVGLSQIANAFPILRRKLFLILLRLFGYPKLLIRELHKEESR